MAGCCDPRPYEKLFGAKTAERDARRYRRRGLTGTAHDLVTLAGNVRSATVLDVGGGVGAIDLELLAAGAARATSVELSSGYEAAAAKLLAERGLGERVDRRVADFATEPLDAHDVVVMHRVVCCYPDVDLLVGAAAERTRRQLLLTYPQERWWVRAGVRLVNLGLRAFGSGFRTYVHPVARIAEAASAQGLAPGGRRRRGLLWESAAFVRG